MHVEICDVSCVLVKTLKTQKQIKFKKKRVILLDNLVMIRSCLRRFCAANSC